MNNQGVGAEGLLAAQSVLAADGDDFGNDGRVEHLWVLKAIEHAEVYFNLLCAIDPKMLNKLSGSRETDDEIFADFRKSFPDLNVAKFSEDDIKSSKAKAEWREFCERWKHLEDYSLGSLLRLDSSGDYSEENTCISVKIQFLAIEIARNKGGYNDDLRKNFKPTPRKSKQQQAVEDASTAQVEAELKQVLSGQHPLLS